jgi:hypothetical protein
VGALATAAACLALLAVARSSGSASLYDMVRHANVVPSLLAAGALGTAAAALGTPAFEPLSVGGKAMKVLRFQLRVAALALAASACSSALAAHCAGRGAHAVWQVVAVLGGLVALASMIRAAGEGRRIQVSLARRTREVSG